MSVSSVLQACWEISLSLSPFPPYRHLRRFLFHVWLLFSLSTKLTTRNVKLCKVRRPQGTPWCQPAMHAFVVSVCREWGSNLKTEKIQKWNGLIRADGRMEIYVCVFVSLAVCHCMCVSVSVFAYVCLRRTACSGTGGLSGWIRQKPGAVLCTIRIKVAISGCYLLRDVLSSQFWWPLCPSPLKKSRDGLYSLGTRLGPIFMKLTISLSSHINVFLKRKTLNILFIWNIAVFHLYLKFINGLTAALTCIWYNYVPKNSTELLFLTFSLSCRWCKKTSADNEATFSLANAKRKKTGLLSKTLHSS